jgi:para-nitrobenzyl esterase
MLTIIWKKIHLQGLAIICALILSIMGLVGCEDSLVVELQDGKVRGVKSGNARLFLKIPYAKPPIGERRWKAPQTNDSWRPLVRYETNFSDSCPQLKDQGSPASNNEDCLYLNVWAP